MSRSFANSLMKLAREHAREQERRLRETQREIREAERARKTAERARVYDIREKKRLYQEDRIAEVAEMNEALEKQLDELQNLLVRGIGVATEINFERLAVMPELPVLDLEDLSRAEPNPNWEEYSPKVPHILVAWLPPVKKSRATQVAQARQKFETDCRNHSMREVVRFRNISERKEEHRRTIEALQIKAEVHNTSLRGWQQAFLRGEKEAIEDYVTLVLSQCARPQGFPQKTRVAYVSASKQLVIECELPEMDAVVPACKAFSYVKATDKVHESSLPEKQRRALYSGAVAQTVLLTLHELFTSEQHGFVNSIVLSGFVGAVNPGTGQRIRPCIVTVRSTRETLATMNLKNVDAAAALRTLNASFSKSPAELAPVRPILEFDMVDPRFVKESDVLSTLDQRPNLMELNPSEFESLITNLFQKMGLDEVLPVLVPIGA